MEAGLRFKIQRLDPLADLPYHLAGIVENLIFPIWLLLRRRWQLPQIVEFIAVMLPGLKIGLRRL